MEWGKIGSIDITPLIKTFFKKIIGSFLATKAHQFLKANRVKVIAVTGSIGKTSTKEAIYTVLKSKFEVSASKKSFNTPIGMSLAILAEEESGFSSPTAWLKILGRVLFKSKKAPQMMVLEMGVDKPGDMDELLKIAPPHLGVVTWVKPVHLGEGQFESLEDIAKEKGKLVGHLASSGLAILNADDERVRTMFSPAEKMMYGTHGADLVAKNIQSNAATLKFEAHYKHQKEAFEVPLIGDFQVHVCLPAIAVGLSLGMTLKECSEALKEFKLPPGRMNPIEGLSGSHILDGSYNASPSTVLAALDMLSNFNAPRKIAALGTMNELGELSKMAHLDVGQKAAKTVQLLIAVGPEAETIKQGALKGGMDQDDVYTFLDSKKAGLFLKKQLKKNDLILVKGSQNKVRMERLVKAIMKDPEKAAELLCRQGREWEEIS